MEKVLDFIKEFQKFGISVYRCFLEGNCYYFYVILKSRFPQAHPYYVPEECHVITEIDGVFFDITGKISEKRLKNLKMVPYESVSQKIRNDLEKSYKNERQ